MQNAQLADDVTAKDHALAGLQQESQRLRFSLEEQVALLGEFESKLARQTAEAEREIASLRSQLANAPAARGSVARGGAGVAAGSDEEEEYRALETQLIDAEGSVSALAAEKVQLLEAYELLEEDTGRQIDEAVAAQQARNAQIAAQLEVRCSVSRRLRLLHCAFRRCSCHLTVAVLTL